MNCPCVKDLTGPDIDCERCGGTGEIEIPKCMECGKKISWLELWCSETCLDKIFPEEAADNSKEGLKKEAAEWVEEAEIEAKAWRTLLVRTNRRQ